MKYKHFNFKNKGIKNEQLITTDLKNIYIITIDIKNYFLTLHID